MIRTVKQKCPESLEGKEVLWQGPEREWGGLGGAEELEEGHAVGMCTADEMMTVGRDVTGNARDTCPSPCWPGERSLGSLA